jgi:hypothetical protein
MAVTVNIDSQVLTFANFAAFPATGSAKTIYIAENTKFQYYWDGNSYELLTTDISLPANLTFYNTTAASNVAGYDKVVISIDDPDYDTVAVNVSTGAITTTAQPVGSFVSDAGIFAGNPGVINISTVGEIRRTSGSGTAEFYYEVYQRDSLGNETLIATSNKTTPVTTSVYQQFQASALFNNGTWLSTDRVVIKYYADRLSGGSNPVYQFLVGGSNPVRTLFPISAQLLLNVPIAIGITGITGSTANRVLTVDISPKLGQSSTTTTELGYLSGVTSNIQTQLNGKQASLGFTPEDVANKSTDTALGTSNTLYPTQGAVKSYVDTGLNGKQNTLTNPVTGTGTNNEIAAFNSTGSTITSLTTATYPSLTELSYVKGVTSAIQTQINGKQDLGKGVNVIYRDFTTSAALTGTTSITLINSALIAANTVSVNDEIEIKARAQKNTSTGTATHYLYYNTSASLSGATLIGSAAAAGGYFATNRTLFVKSATDSETSNSSLGLATSDAATGGTVTSVSNFNIDWTSDVYIIQAFANAAVGNSTTSNGIIIKRARL